MTRKPSFYDPSAVGELYIERGALVEQEALRWMGERGFAPSAEDEYRVAAFGIDCQVGFCHPEASLFVPGAVEDMERTLGWLYRNLEQISGLYFSLDTHEIFQIFHPAYWRDGEGKPPAPLTPITVDDIEQGRWTPLGSRELSLEYCRKLEETGRYTLTIWPYHTLLGGASHALVPALMEASMFHGLLRGAQPHFVTKGRAPMTENYSVFAPEVRKLGGEEVGRFEEEFFEQLLGYDRIYVFGQAKSHCVLSTLRDAIDRLRAQGREEEIGKFHVLVDAMSPVQPPPLNPLPASLDFPAVAEESFARFAEAGMKMVRCEDAIER